MSKTLTVADWSQVPFGRYNPEDGDYNGQKYREEVLAPALKEGAVNLLLAGTAGYGSGFLEEVFGGLIRSESFDLEYLKEHLKVSGSGSYAVYEKQVWNYINTADFQRFSCKPMVQLNDEEIPESFKEACADFNNSKFIDLSDAINTPFPS